MRHRMRRQPAIPTLESLPMPSAGVLVAATQDARLLRILDSLAEDLALPLKVGEGTAELEGALGSPDDHLLVLDWRQPSAGAPEVASWLASRHYRLPHLAVVAPGAVSATVQALRNGAFEAVELGLGLPGQAAASDEVEGCAASSRIGSAFALAADQRRAAVQERIQLLELRRRHAALRDIERKTMAAMVAGMLNKQLALELRIAERTVKKHRATVLKQMGAASLADLVRMAIRLQLA